MKLTEKIKENKKELIFFFLAFVNILIVLSPILKSGYIGDDAINSSISGFLAGNNQSLFSYVTMMAIKWIKSGRFFPLSLYGSAVFFFVRSVFLYKLSIVIMTCLNTLLLYYFIKVLTKSKSLALFTMVWPPLFFQLRLYHDTLISYVWLMQLIFLYLLISLIFLVLYLQNGKKRYLLLSAIIYLFATLTYEISYTFFVFHLLIVFFHERRKISLVFKKAWLFILLPVVLSCSVLLLRAFYKVPMNGTEYGPYVPNFKLLIFFSTLLKQTSAALPLSYYVLDPHKIFDGLNKIIVNNIWLGLFIIAIHIALFILGYQIIKKEPQNTSKINFNLLLIFGFCLLILPGVLISLSPKYQMEISWGVGYLPVYISYFGVMLFLSVFTYKSLTKKLLWGNAVLIAAIIALISGFTSTINYNANALVVDKINENWLYPRNVIEKALTNGLFKGVPDKVNLFIGGNYYWDQVDFYNMHTGKKFKDLGLYGSYLSVELPHKFFKGNFETYKSYNFSKANNYLYLRYKAETKDKGYAIFSKINSILINDKELKFVAARNIRIFVYSEKSEEVSFNFSYLDKNKRALAKNETVDAREIKTISSKSRWYLYELNKKDRYIDAESVKVNFGK